MGVGVHMKNIIREKGLTIKNVSEKSGVAVNTLYSITKRDSVRVDCIILSRIAGALGVRVQDLIGDDADLKRKGAETMTIDTAKVEILMAEQGLNQKELGERCGMPRQNISSIIRRGKAEPRTVGKLAGGLGVTVAEIVPAKEPQVMDALRTDTVGLMNDIEVQGTFNAQTFFDTLAAILSRKYGKEIFVKVTEQAESDTVTVHRNQITAERPGA